MRFFSKKAHDEPVLPTTSEGPSRQETTVTEIPDAVAAAEITSLPPLSTPASPTRANTLKSSKTPPSSRPTLAHSASRPTRYMSMLLALDTVPRLHNILASFFCWLLLAGYVVFPATFTSVDGSNVLNQAANNGNIVAKDVLGTVKNAPLLYIAGACCIIGVTGMLWLWWRWAGNYVWMINRVFLPTFLNSIAGLISTLVNVYTAQHGQFSVTAKVTVIVTAACSGVALVLFVLYNNWALERVKSKHHRQMASEAREAEGEHEGVVDMVMRKAHEPPLEPGSVV